MLEVDEVWFDLSDDGTSSHIRLAVRPEKAAGLKLASGINLQVELSGPHGRIGHAELRYIACIKGRAILEVVRLLPVSEQCPDPSLCLPAVSCNIDGLASGFMPAQ